MTSARDDSAELVTLTEAAARLGVHYMTAYRYVRTGRLDGAKHGPEWRVRAADVERLLAAPPTDARSGDPEAAHRDHAGRRRTNWAARAEEPLVRGDEAAAWSVLEAAMASGMTPESIYVEVLAPAMRSIGERWANEELTVADEHQASAIALRLVGRLGPRFARRGRKRGTIVLAAPDGDDHGLPVAILADLLRGRGFRVIDLGADVPSDSLASTIAGVDGLVAVGLGATVSDNDAAIADAVRAIRSVSSAPVVLGGRAIAGPDDARRLGADDGGRATPEVLDLFERVVRASA